MLRRRRRRTPKFHQGPAGIAGIPAKLQRTPIYDVRGGFASVCVIHGLATELGAVLGWALAAGWHVAVELFAEIEMMIDVSVEVFGGSGTRVRRR